MPLKIVALSNNGYGLMQFRKELLLAIHKKYFTTIAVPDIESIKQLRFFCSEVVQLDIARRGKNIFKDFALLISYYKLLRHQKPDVVLTYTVKPNIYGNIAATLLGIPVIANITGLGSAMNSSSRLKNFLLFLYRIAFYRVHHVFFQNQENMELFQRQGIAVGRSSLLPGSGVNLEEHALLPYPDDSVINFLFIGRVMREKGIEEYLTAAKYIRTKYSNTCFYVLGGIEEDKYETILKDATTAGFIKNQGHVRNVSEYQALSHCTILPSYHEGMSNTLLESAAHGRPVITNDVCGCRETVDNGVSGFLVRKADTADLIAKIELFLTLSHARKEAMGLAGRAKMEREFDRSIVVNAYLDEIAKL